MFRYDTNVGAEDGTEHLLKCKAFGDKFLNSDHLCDSKKDSSFAIDVTATGTWQTTAKKNHRVNFLKGKSNIKE